MELIESQAHLHEQIYSDEHRKLHGTHYTPDLLVDYIVRRTLKTLPNSPDILKNIRILDPACGSGLFLLKAYEVMADHWRKVFGKFGKRDAQHILGSCIFGIDIDERAVLETKKNLAKKASFSESDLKITGKNIITGDALSFTSPSGLIPVQPLPSSKQYGRRIFLNHSYDYILGNPPYIRIQNTPSEKRGWLTSSYTTASGRFDLSALFIELSEYLLTDGGRLGFIISNKILTTAGARKLRTFLLTHFSIEEIVDLRDTKLFEAAVLPMILIASRAKKDINLIRYSSIAESNVKNENKISADNVLNLLDNNEIPFDADISVSDKVFKLQRFYVHPPSLRDKVWSFHNENEDVVLSKIYRNSGCTLKNISRKISVGLKTTADNVFIKPMMGDFIRQQELEKGLIFPVLESHNINRWSCSWDPHRDLFVLYPHIEKNGKVVPVDLVNYPRIKAYLENHRMQLESRKYLINNNRRWYEIWVHQSPSDFRKRKIITPDISSHNRFALDDKGFYVNGTCFFIILADESDDCYFSTLGLLNSRVIEYFHKMTSSNSLYAKRFRYWASYIGEFPVAKELVDSKDTRTLIAKRVRLLLNGVVKDEQVILEKEIDDLCYKLFDLKENDITEIETTLFA